MKWKTRQAIFAIGSMVLVILAVPAAVRTRARAAAVAIGDLAWDRSNINVLRSADLSDVQKFFNRSFCRSDQGCGINVVKFGWADFGGNGKYQLVYVWDTGRRAQGVTALERDASGKVSQLFDFEGGADEDLPIEVKDLKGDGKDQLIIYRWFGMGQSMADSPLAYCPMVYRLQNGQLAEASRDFADYYDKEVLPPIEKQIVELQKQLDSEGRAKASGEAVMREYHWIASDIANHTSPEEAKAVSDSERLALQQSLRNYIQHLLGRGPRPDEENEAREWLRSSDERLVRFAESAFREMGDKAEERETQQKLHSMSSEAHEALADERRIAPVLPPSAAP